VESLVLMAGLARLQDRLEDLKDPLGRDFTTAGLFIGGKWEK